MHAIDDDASNRHPPAQPRLQRRLDSQPDQVAEVGGAEVVPAAADDDEEDEDPDDDSADQPAETAPHRPAALTLACRAVMMLFSRGVVFVHPDSRSPRANYEPKDRDRVSYYRSGPW